MREILRRTAESDPRSDDVRRSLPEVVILRHNLFRVSEPFITAQAQHLQRYRPFYLGRLRFGSPPEGAASGAFDDLFGWSKYPRVLWNMLANDPGPYLHLLSERQPALLHAHFGIEGLAALPLAKRLRVPLVTTFHGFDVTLSRTALLTSPAWIRYAFGRTKLAEKGDLFLCASEFLRTRLLSLGFPEERTKVHYIGVDCEAITVRDPSEEEPVILHIARLVEVKGTEFLIRALAKLTPNVGDIQLVVIGDGPRRQRLEALADSLGVTRNVRFLGALPHEQVLPWIRRASLLVVPSVTTSTGRVEGLGMVHLEASATGVPSIGSACGGIPEGIVDGETGYLVPEKDVEALAERINHLLTRATERQRLGSNARRFVEEKFHLGRQTAKLESLYDHVRNGQPMVSNFP